MSIESLIKVKGRQVAPRVSEGVETDLWVKRDGSLVMTPIELAWAEEGRVFVANVGSATTPATFGAGSIDTTEPDFDLLVPAGASIMVVPLQILIHMEAFGTTALFEGMASYGLGGAQNSTGATSLTGRNLRTDAPYASGCTLYGNSDAGATYMTQNVGEIFRFGTEAIATVGIGDDDSNRVGNTYCWSARESGIYPHLVPSALAARLNVFAAAQAGTGFIQVMWAELPR